MAQLQQNRARWLTTGGALVLSLTLVAGCASATSPGGSTLPEPVASNEGTEQEGSESTAESEGSENSTSESAPGQPQAPVEKPAEKPAESSPPDPPASPSTPPAPSNTTEPTSPPAAAGPAVLLTSMSCNGSGPHQKLKVQLTANYNNKYRKGIQSVALTRHDERGTAWISQKQATWAGQYAGKGDMWSGELPSRNPSQEDYGTGNDYGKVLKLRVRTDDGKHWEFEHVINRDC